MLLAQLAISVLNDFADRERDAHTGRLRALPLGSISPRGALALAILLAALSLLSSLVMGDGLPASGLLLAGLLTGFLYDLWLKPTPLSPLPFALAFPVLLVWVELLAHHGPPTALCFLAGMPLAVAIHLGDSIPDRTVDLMAGGRPLAVALPAATVQPLAATLVLVGALVMAVTVQGAAVAGLIMGLGVVGGAGSFLVTGARWTIALASVSMVSLWVWKGVW
jgi:4-hydroxybenzoate polyprenyltransferase